MGERGLACPLLVISDGAAGLVGAIERTMGAALRQRCLIHRARINVLAKVPKNAHADMKADYWAIFDLPESVAPGLEAVAIAQQRIDAFAQLARLVSGSGALSARRPRLADGVPAVPA